MCEIKKAIINRNLITVISLVETSWEIIGESIKLDKKDSNLLIIWSWIRSDGWDLFSFISDIEVVIVWMRR